MTNNCLRHSIAIIDANWWSSRSNDLISKTSPWYVRESGGRNGWERNASRTANLARHYHITWCPESFLKGSRRHVMSWFLALYRSFWRRRSHHVMDASCWWEKTQKRTWQQILQAPFVGKSEKTLPSRVWPDNPSPNWSFRFGDLEGSATYFRWTC